MDRFECNGKLNLHLKPHKRFEGRSQVRLTMSHACKHIKYYHINRKDTITTRHHPDLHPLHPPSPDDLEDTIPNADSKEMEINMKNTLASGNLLYSSDTNDGESDYEDAGNDGSNSESEANAGDDVLDDENGDAEERRSTIKQDYETLILNTYDLLDIIKYNASYADPTVYTLLHQRLKPALELLDIIQQKEKHVNSNTQSNPPTFSRKYAAVMKVKTRDKAAIANSRREGKRLLQ